MIQGESHEILIQAQQMPRLQLFIAYSSAIQMSKCHDNRAL